MTLDIQHLQQWIGKTEHRTDQVTPVPYAALSAVLDRDTGLLPAGMPLPPLWHWLYFLPLHKQSEIGEDGHPQRGGFLPPVPLPRRMWAGGRLKFLQDLRVGDAVERTSRVANVDVKEGKSGRLVFLLVQHEIRTASGTAVIEEQDIVYRDMPSPNGHQPAPQFAPALSEWERQVTPDEVMLFRYSALTFNDHRIHYDRKYATGTEGYPGLVVHGPLIATLLLDLVRRHRPEAVVREFSFRAVRPLFDIASFDVCGMPSKDGKTVRLWAKDTDGFLAMEASATLA
ncbi:MAG TPA: MaoC family dehydratase N-terminal domain-containing protein [Noviherbaspirillum sp.]|nr:MaoC family dehydratase N-terminal domain-containing protein [Noviherbaspirillum sp.]